MPDCEVSLRLRQSILDTHGEVGKCFVRQVVLGRGECQASDGAIRKVGIVAGTKELSERGNIFS